MVLQNLSLLGLVHTYPDTLENASFSIRIKISASTQGALSKIYPSTRRRCWALSKSIVFGDRKCRLRADANPKRIKTMRFQKYPHTCWRGLIHGRLWKLSWVYIQLKKIVREISTYPFPSRSYIENAHLSFCSSVPLLVTDNAQMNSRKSILPSPFWSKVRNTCSANLAASPYGKKLP